MLTMMMQTKEQCSAMFRNIVCRVHNVSFSCHHANLHHFPQTQSTAETDVFLGIFAKTKVLEGQKKKNEIALTEAQKVQWQPSFNVIKIVCEWLDRARVAVKLLVFTK